MADGFKDTLESMNFSTAQLEDILEIAKQSEARQFNDSEFQQIKEALHLLSSKADMAKSILSKSAGGLQLKNTQLELANQYQAMDALVANMAQSLLGIESVRNRFEKVYGNYSTALAGLSKAQNTAGATRVRLTQFSLNETRNTINQIVAEFRRQLQDQITKFEALGAEYFQFAASKKLLPRGFHHAAPPEQPAGENNGQNGANGQNSNAQNGENEGVVDDLPADSSQAVVAEEETQQTVIPLGGVAMGGFASGGFASGGETQAAPTMAAPGVAGFSGGEHVAQGAAPAPGIAPAAGEHSAPNAAATPGAAPAGEHAPGAHIYGTPGENDRSAMEMTQDAERGRAEKSTKSAKSAKTDKAEKSTKSKKK